MKRCRQGGGKERGMAKHQMRKKWYPITVVGRESQQEQTSLTSRISGNGLLFGLCGGPLDGWFVTRIFDAYVSALSTTKRLNKYNKEIG